MESGSGLAPLHRGSRFGFLLDDGLPVLVAALSFAYLAAYPPAIGRADESHLLHEAQRVFDGQAPYADFFESLTPLSLYLFAGIYWIGGLSLQAARIGMAIINAIGCALLFQLTRRVAGSVEAAVLTLITMGLCIPTWPYASAHWVSTTLGLLVAAVLLADRWQHSLRARPLVAGVLAGAAFCVQQQRGAFVCVWLPLALAILSAALPRGQRWQTVRAAVAWSIAGATLTIAAILGYAASQASLWTMVDMAFGFAVKHYGPTQAGVVTWAKVQPLTPTAARTWPWLLRISPAFLLVEGLVLLVSGRCPRDRRDLQRAALYVLALLMGVSVWYLPDVIHVSFVVPFLLIPAATLLHRLRAPTLWGRWPIGHQIATGAAALAAAVLVVKAGANVVNAYADAPAQFDTAFGTVRTSDDMARLYDATRRHLVRESDGRYRLALFPNDAWLFLTLQADNVSPFSALVPVMFPPEDLETFLATLRAQKAGTIVTLMPLAIREGERIKNVIEAGYDRAEDVGKYRVYVRRDAVTVPPAATRGESAS